MAFGVTQQHRDEAQRLLDLDDKGREVELLAFLLAETERSDNASKELQELDRRMLNDYLGDRAAAGALDGSI